MGNRVSVELGLNVSGYKKGMQDAKDSTQQYNTETKKISENLGNFRQEIGRAKKEVQNLALAYSRLSAEEKKSQFGREMKTRLDAAKKSTADLIDLQGDLQQELKNLASDTKTFNMMSEGLGTVADIASGAMGAIAMFTGNAEDAQRAVVAFTTAQSVLGAVTKIQNALQMQSNTMMAITTIQDKAAAAAANMKAAAEGRGVIATKAATAAQAAFNAVANANPYVLLAMAITGVIAALGAFIMWSNKSEQQQERENKAKEKAKSINDAYYNTLNDSIADTMTSYTRLQSEWKSLSSESEKNQWIQDNKDKFHELGIEINTIQDAENVLVTNTEAVKEAFMERAKAAAMAAKAAELYKQALDEAPKAGDKMSVKDASALGLDITKRKVDRNWFSDNEITISADEEKKVRADKMKEAEKQIGKLYDDMTEHEKKAATKLAEAGVKAYNKARAKAQQKDKKKDEILNPESVAYAEEKLKKLEEKRTKIPIDSSDLPKLKEDIEKWKKEVEARKIKVGISLGTTSSETLSELQKNIQKEFNNAAADLTLATMSGNIDDIEKYALAFDKSKQKLEDFNATYKLVTEGITSTGSLGVQAAKNGNFAKSIQGYEDAISALQGKMKTLDLSDGLKETQDEWEKMAELVAKYTEQLGILRKKETEDTMTQEEKEQEALDKKIKKYEKIGNALNTVGDAFSQLGKLADDNPVLNIAGIVAQACANIALAYAQALGQDKTTKSNIWLFIAAAAASVISMAAAISQVHSSTGYAQGGIVGGNSYSGDHIAARLNSGEMVLNKRQQQNLFNAINSGNLSTGGTSSVQVSGVIRGTDILLVQKNANKQLSRTGTQIKF
jgi:DNA repair exonuclease SbcCD ATPase subunit